MTYNAKLTALHKGLTSIHPDQDRINFAPRLNSDIRFLKTDGTYLEFNAVKEDGTVWVVSDIDGWWNISDPEMPEIPRGFGDGSFDISGRYQTRLLTFSGSIIVTSGDRTTIGTSSAAARKELVEVLNLVKRGTWMIVDEDNYKRAAFVRLSGRPDISTVNSRGRIDFSFGLKAPDPVKYEWVPNTPATTPSGEERLGNGYNVATIYTSSLVSDYREYIDTENNWSLEASEATDSGYSPDFQHSYSDTSETWSLSGETYSDYVKVYGGDTSQLNQQYSDSVTITNNGDTNVYCYLRVIGPFFGPATIQNRTTGQTMNFVAPTNDENQFLGPVGGIGTQYLDIDTRTHEVHLGDYVNGESSGSSRSWLEPLVDWIYLQPGDNTIYFNDAGSQSAATGAILQVYWRSGWIG